TITAEEAVVIGGAGVHAYVTVPLVKEGVWVAVIAVNSIAPRAWTVDEVVLIEKTAERTWAAVERARAESALRESRATMALELKDARQLQSVSSLLIKDESGTGIYDEILDAAMVIMRADFSSIQMLDEDRGELRLLAWKNFHPESAAHWQRVSMETGT